MSGQPQPSGQPGPLPGPPGQHPQAPHAITNAGASRGVFTQEHVAQLAESQGWIQDVTSQYVSQTIPIWSDDTWNGTYQTFATRTSYTLRQIGAGDFFSKSRPAIRPLDEPSNPSEYARRFGLLHRDVIRDAWGHSGLTPTDPAFQTSSQRPEDDDFDESLQSLFFDYTSAELVAQGALNPRLSVPWPPDLDEPIHPLFERTRWHQTGDLPTNYWRGVFDVRYGSLLNGTPGVYNAMTNQAVWDAIEPALKLASRIIRSNHPYWLAMTSMFHLRPVPDAKDGRTPEQKAAQGGTPYTSVWLDDDENDPRVPAPYPEMAILKGLGFDSAVSRAVCMEVLLKNLRLQIMQVDSTLGMTYSWGDYNMIVSINATMIWPLLITRHRSASEKASFTFAIASCLLHELSHACAIILRDMTCRPNLFYTSSFGPKMTQEMWASLLRLGNQIYGPCKQDPYWKWFDRPCPRQQLFAEDEVQGEDGLNFEKQLWGGRVVPHYGFGQLSFAMSPLLVLLPWPSQHPQPLQQGRTLLDQEDTAYERFLADPRARSWHQNLALPIEWYARHFQKAWWQSSFQKFNHHALKLSTNDPSLPTSILRAAGADAVITDDQEDMAMFWGAETWKWMRGTLLATIEKKDMIILSHYLRGLIGQASAAKMFGVRFSNEMMSWPRKNEQMVAAARGVSDDYQTMVNLINRHLSPSAAAFDADSAAANIGEINGSVQRVLGPMLELSRLMSQDVAYQQYMLTQYLHLDTNVKAIFVDRMQAMGMMTETTLHLLSGRAPNVPLQFSTLTPETQGGLANTMQQKMFAYLLDDSQRQRELVIGSPPGATEAAASEFVDLIGEIGSLHRSFQTHFSLLLEMNTLIHGCTVQGRVPDSAEWPRLQSFARVRRRRWAGAYEAAALREIREVNSRALASLLYEGLTLIASKLEPGAIDPARLALKSGVERNVARQTALKQDWQLFLRNEKQAEVRRAAARQAQLPGVPNDTPPRELLRRMWDMANGNADDQRLLKTMYSPASVQQTMSSIDLSLPV